MELYALAGLLFLGHKLKNKSTNVEKIDKNIIKPNEIPNQSDRYASRHSDKVLAKQLKLSTDNWDASKDINKTGVLPVAFKDRTQQRTVIDIPDQKLVQNEDSIKYLKFNNKTRNPLQSETFLKTEQSVPTAKELDKFGTQTLNAIRNKLKPLAESFEGITEQFKSGKRHNQEGNKKSVVEYEGFTHNNMQPYFGGKMTQNLNPQAHKSRLEMNTGTNPIYKHKKEIGRLFPLEKNYNVFGATVSQNRQDDRYTLSVNKNGVKPFEQIRVPRGLNKGRNNSTDVGFHDPYRVRQKTVNELRIVPRETYSIPPVPGKHYVTSRQKELTLNKNSNNKRYLTNFESTKSDYDDIKVRPLVPAVQSGEHKPTILHKDGVILKNSQKDVIGERGGDFTGPGIGEVPKNYVHGDIRVSNKPVIQIDPIEAVKKGEGTYNMYYEAPKTTLKEQTIDGVHNMINLVPNTKKISVYQYEKPNTTIKEQTLYEYNGGAKGFNKQTDRTGAQNIEFNGLKETTIHNREPTTRKHDKIYNKSFVNMDINKIQHNTYEINKRVNKSFNIPTTSKDIIGKTTVQRKQYSDNKLMTNRIDPNIIKSYKENPYTQQFLGVKQTYSSKFPINKITDEQRSKIFGN